MQATADIMESRAVPIGGGANHRTERDFARARRHSWFVKAMKGVLPLTALLVVLGFAGLAALSYSPLAALDLAGVGIEDGRLVMREPKLNGFDRNNRPYNVEAASAVQNLTNPDAVQLEAISARLPMEDGSEVTVSARNGLYDSKGETLRLDGDIEVGAADGMKILLQSADIDVEAGTMNTADPVQVTTPEAKVTADRLDVDDGGERIVFRGNVRMEIQRSFANDEASR